MLNTRFEQEHIGVLEFLGIMVQKILDGSSRFE